MTVDLGTFEGRDVLNSSIAIRKAGDGLSQALKLDPVVLHQGQKVYVVLECVVGPIAFKPIDDTDCVARVQDLIAGVATIMDDVVVSEAIDRQRERLDRAADLAKGQGRLPTDEEHHAAHTNGEHASGLVDGCVDCEGEKEAARTEAAGVSSIGRRRRTKAAAALPAVVEAPPAEGTTPE